MIGVYNFDDADDTAEPVDLDGAVYGFDLPGPLATDRPAFDLDGALAAQFGPGVVVESLPIFTERVGEVMLSAIRVTAGVPGRTRYQLYITTAEFWLLAAIFGNYCSTLREILRWRRYLEQQGGTVAEWLYNHGDMITPENSGF